MPFVLLPKLRSEVVEVCQRLHQNSWVANHDGNLSVRLKGDRLLVTPTAFSKRDVEASSLLVVDLQGNILEGRYKPFSELEIHLACYRAREEVEVVLHAHPPYSTALGLVGATLAPIALPEMMVSLGANIPTVSRFLPKDSEGLEKVRAAAATSDAFLISGNGTWTMGADLKQAFLRMELVEHYARILSLARHFGEVKPLEDSSVQKLLEARKKAGLGPKV